MEFSIIIKIVLFYIRHEKFSLENRLLISTTRHDCRCGQVVGKTGETRITGGIVTDPHAFPWQALILIEPRMCGGSVLNDLYILTAGHCAAPFQIEDMVIVLGVHDLHQIISKTYKFYFVVKKIVHEKYKNNANDIALLKLHRRITFNEYIKPICLPQPREQIEGKIATVIGWGFTAYKRGRPSQFLRETQLTVMKRKQCLESKIGRSMGKGLFCATGKIKDACQGDSGGPLFYETSNKIAVQIGIVSSGADCGKYPGLYTTVPDFHDWILKHTENARYCTIEL